MGAQMNHREARQADRGQHEQHVSYAIKPGDRIRALRARSPGEDSSSHEGAGAFLTADGGACKTMSASVMLSELTAATSFTDPQEVRLCVSRNLADVMKPAADSGYATTDASSSPLPPRSPTTLQTSGAAPTDASSSPLPPRPPTTPQRSGTAPRRSRSTVEMGRQYEVRSRSPGIARGRAFDDISFTGVRRVSSRQRLAKPEMVRLDNERRTF